jgi:hypothetical protein
MLLHSIATAPTKLEDANPTARKNAVDNDLTVNYFHSIYRSDQKLLTYRLVSLKVDTIWSA